MGDAPAMLSYGRPARRGGRRFVLWAVVLLGAGTAAAGWRYREPVLFYVVDRYATWQFARAFDKVSAELTGDDGVWLAPTADAAPDDRAKRQLLRLLALSPDPQAAAHATPPPPVLFVLAGQTGRERWLSFACLTTAGLQTLTFERGGKGTHGFDLVLRTPGLAQSAAAGFAVRGIERQGSAVRATIDLGGGRNEIRWVLDAGMASSVPGGGFNVPSTVVPETGWASDGAWWPATRGWRLIDGRPHERTVATDAGGAALSFLPDGRLASVGPFRVRLIDLDSDEPERHPLPDDLSAAEVYTFSPDGTKLFVGGWSQPAALIDVLSGRARRYSYSTSGRAKASFAEDRTLIYLDNVRRVRLDWETLKSETLKLEPEGSFLGFGAAGELIAFPVGSEIVVRHLRTLDDVAKVEPVPGLHQVSLSPDGRWLALKGQAGLRLVDAASGATLWDHAGDDLHTPHARLKWSADGSRGAVAGGQYAYVWSMAEPRWVARLRHGLPRGSLDVALSPDGRQLAVGALGANAIPYWPDVDAAVGVAGQAAAEPAPK